MKSLRFLDRRSGYSLASIGLLLGMVVPTLVPAFASAGQVTTRSVTLSNSAKNAAGVSYQLQATAESAIASGGGLVLEFCTESPLPGYTCTHPTGLSTSGVGASIGTATAVASNGAIKWTAGTGISAAGSITVTFTGIHNPTAAGTFYGRIYTYANATDLTTPGFVSATSLGTTADTGAVALSATDEVGITAYVLETMTFCVWGAAPDQNCSGTYVSPSMTIGETVGTQKVLQANAVSTGTVYAQLSTNASSGAVVNLKSDSTSCGGLYRNGNPVNCGITAQTTSPATSGDIVAGQAKFGLTVGSSSNATGVGTPSGTFAASGLYDPTKYYIDYAAGNATGVTSTYGSPLLNTSNGPVNNKNIPITFGASIANDTAAGVYGARLSLIATGTF